MTEMRILILIVLAQFGYFAWQIESAKPTREEIALRNHCDIMLRLGRDC